MFDVRKHSEIVTNKDLQGLETIGNKGQIIKLPVKDIKRKKSTPAPRYGNAKTQKLAGVNFGIIPNVNPFLVEMSNSYYKSLENSGNQMIKMLTESSASKDSPREPISNMRSRQGYTINSQHNLQDNELQMDMANEKAGVKIKSQDVLPQTSSFKSKMKELEPLQDNLQEAENDLDVKMLKRQRKIIDQEILVLNKGLR